VKLVSDAGPLIILAKLGQLGLLLKLYTEILISNEVYQEVVVNGSRLGAADAQIVDFLVRRNHIQVIDVILPVVLPNWALALDAGELETIFMAKAQAADWVLVDDIQARKAARREGLQMKGTVGILLAAFREGYLSLPEFEVLIEQIKIRPEFWISQRLCDEVLAQARKEAR
jgi:predicted nucleic acid-binding protein